MNITELEPKEVWKNFYSLTRIPRPSKHEEKASEYLYNFGKGLGLETIKDKMGNVIIRKPATPGCEKMKGVILQGHMDMVPQKTADSSHNFLEDPIETWVDGDWVKAKGTTLGADDGLGLAMAMAVLESKTLRHGPIEVVATVDEETGLTGAQYLEPGILKGEILLNLDSEDEGELCVGCAGGVDVSATGRYDRLDEPKDHICYTLALKKFKGGHSGTEIHLGRANANKMMARVLYALLSRTGVKLIDMEGGTLRNAISRDCFATVYIPKEQVHIAQDVAASAFAEIKNEYALTDPDCEMIFEPYKEEPGQTCDPDECRYVKPEQALAIVQAILVCPDGVERMSAAVPGLVETSINMAMVKIYGGQWSVHALGRSSVDTAKMALAQKMTCAFALAGGRTEFKGAYSGWAPNPDSEIVKLLVSVHKDVLGYEPKVLAVHAGLECGIIGGIYPSLDMVSFGPTLRGAHSPEERASISSTQRYWKFLTSILENIPTK